MAIVASAQAQNYYDQNGRPLAGPNGNYPSASYQRGDDSSDEAHRRNDERKDRKDDRKKNRKEARNDRKHDHDHDHDHGNDRRTGQGQPVYDRNGRQVGTVNAPNQPVYDRNGRQVGTVNAQGQVVAPDANSVATQIILDAVRR